MGDGLLNYDYGTLSRLNSRTTQRSDRLAGTSSTPSRSSAGPLRPMGGRDRHRQPVLRDVGDGAWRTGLDVVGYTGLGVGASRFGARVVLYPISGMETQSHEAPVRALQADAVPAEPLRRRRYPAPRAARRRAPTSARAAWPLAEADRRDGPGLRSTDDQRRPADPARHGPAAASITCRASCGRSLEGRRYAGPETDRAATARPATRTGAASVTRPSSSSPPPDAIARSPRLVERARELRRVGHVRAVRPSSRRRRVAPRRVRGSPKATMTFCLSSRAPGPLATQLAITTVCAGADLVDVDHVELVEDRQQQSLVRPRLRSRSSPGFAWPTTGSRATVAAAILMTGAPSWYRG